MYDNEQESWSPSSLRDMVFKISSTSYVQISFVSMNAKCLYGTFQRTERERKQMPLKNRMEDILRTVWAKKALSYALKRIVVFQAFHIYHKKRWTLTFSTESDKHKIRIFLVIPFSLSTISDNEEALYFSFTRNICVYLITST